MSIWNTVARVVSKPLVATALIEWSKRTPYFHLPDYMRRYWLFNRYSEIGSGTIIKKKYPKLPSIRIHHILRADTAEHPHDHPWDARTIILKGWYVEDKEDGEHLRMPGDTGPINFGEYHHIKHVSKGGVWTLFFTWGYMGTWGFLVDGKKIPHNEYTGRT